MHKNYNFSNYETKKRYTNNHKEWEDEVANLLDPSMIENSKFGEN
jgi:hypothetical protein